jgi:hypothetical protein
MIQFHLIFVSMLVLATMATMAATVAECSSDNTLGFADRGLLCPALSFV